MAHMEDEVLRLMNENHRLRLELSVLRIDQWYIKEILKNKSVRAYRQIMLADEFELKCLLPLLDEFGYEYLNDYFMELLDEEIKKEEAEKEGVKEDGE